MNKPLLASIALLGLVTAPAMAATGHKAKPAAHKTVKVAKTKTTTTVEKKAK